MEHGIWRGEVLGLEVVRATDSGFETGVGRFDREASSLLHGDLPTTESLAAAADQVRARRPAKVPPAHPLATLARERWLRHDLQADPGRIGLSDLTAVDPAVERVRPACTCTGPCVWAQLPTGNGCWYVCSAGVDTDLVPATADLVLRERPDRVLVVVPPGDILPPVERVVARLAVPATIVGVEGGWA